MTRSPPSENVFELEGKTTWDYDARIFDDFHGMTVDISWSTQLHVHYLQVWSTAMFTG